MYINTFNFTKVIPINQPNVDEMKNINNWEGTRGARSVVRPHHTAVQRRQCQGEYYNGRTIGAPSETENKTLQTKNVRVVKLTS